MELDLPGLFTELSRERPIFHHEADFQHALAWRIHEAAPDLGIRLEYKAHSSPPMYVDIWLSDGQTAIAIELKYLAAACDVKIGHEQYALANQAAQDIRRYDYVKDIGRLEVIVAEGTADEGYAICLSNNRTFWREPVKANVIDGSFRIHEGIELYGQRAWGSAAGSGTMSKRDATIDLSGRYALKWRDYSSVNANRNARFRYLLVHVVPVGRP